MADVLKVDPKSLPDKPGLMRRQLRVLLKAYEACSREWQTLTAEDDRVRKAERRTVATRRKFLTGGPVLDRMLERPLLIRWLRRVLDEGLTRSYDRTLFCLGGEGPLIPEEDWPGWPAPVDATLPEAPPNAMSPGRRRVRLAYLKKKIAAIRAELAPLQKRYAPHRDERNKQRKILVGAVLLTLACRNDRVARWLRLLLDRTYTAPRDRRLFRLEGGGPLVPEEDQDALRPSGRPAAKTASASARTSEGHGTGASGHSNPARTPRGDEAGTDDAPDPIPGWKPYRLEMGAAASGGRTGRSVWGARLTGRAAVAALPGELQGRRITVTDSNLVSWTTTVTDVVSRDEAAVVVRNSGRPDADVAGSRRSPESDSSSS